MTLLDVLRQRDEALRRAEAAEAQVADLTAELLRVRRSVREVDRICREDAAQAVEAANLRAGKYRDALAGMFTVLGMSDDVRRLG